MSTSTKLTRQTFHIEVNKNTSLGRYVSATAERTPTTGDHVRLDVHGTSTRLDVAARDIPAVITALTEALRVFNEEAR